MGFEEFTPKTVNKKALRIGTQIDHVSSSASTEEDGSLVESIIVGSNQATKEELASALSLLMNSISLPVTALAEIEGDQERISQVNTLAQEYFEAVKTLDTKKQHEIGKRLQVLFG